MIVFQGCVCFGVCSVRKELSFKFIQSDLKFCQYAYLNYLNVLAVAGVQWAVPGKKSWQSIDSPSLKVRSVPA